MSKIHLGQIINLPISAPQGRAIAMAAALAIALLGLTMLTADVFDDPAILYRYAVNLATGAGWTFNPGHATANAVTSPLTVLILAGLVKIGLDVWAASATLFMIGSWAASFFTYLTLRTAGREIAGVFAAWFIATTPLLLELRGMESSLYLGLVAVILYEMLLERQVLLGVTVGLTVLARPDGLILLACVLTWLAWRNRRPPILVGSVALAIIAFWLVISWRLSGQILPSTLAAKVAQAQSGEWPGYFFQLHQLLFIPHTPVWTWMLLPLVAGGAVFAMAARIAFLIPLTAAVALQVVAYGLVLRVAGYPWYIALLVYVACMVAGIGADGLIRATGRCRFFTSVLLAMYGVIAILAGLTQMQSMNPHRLEYAVAADWLSSNTAPDSTVAAAEFGRLGLLSNRTMIDYLGLLDPQVNGHVRNQEWAWWTENYQPDYWVTLRNTSWVVDAAVRDQPYFTRVFQPVFETGNLVVYKRQAPVPTCRP